MAIDYEDITAVNKALGDDQNAEQDNRDKARETHNFLDKRDGQWEPSVLSSLKEAGRPRYTFDKCNNVVDAIAGEMEQAEFSVRVRPAGGDASKEDAKTLDGIIRNIENMSGATHIYNSAGREMTAAGLGGWEVAVDWADNDSFDQDLMIRPISNYEDRVWFDCGAELQTQEDANHVFVLQNLTPTEYDARFPKGSKQSIGSDKPYDVYTQKPDFVTVGRILYKQPVDKQIVAMSDGSVHEVNDDFEKVRDELAAQGVTVERERTKKAYKVVSRLFDGSAFLTDKQDTVFDYLPIIPTFGNFKIRESKVIYRGAIDKLLDAQRTYNYARSRETEEVALAPKPKYWATRKMFSNEADRRKVQTLNTNAEPVQLFTFDEHMPQGPQFMGGAAVNPGLQGVVQNSLDDITTTANQLGAQSGNVNGNTAAVAIQALENQGNTNHIKYFKSQELAIQHTGKILVKAIPKVYDTKRQTRILGEDGSFEMTTLNEQVYDQQTGQMVTLNDLTKGKYDVTCDVGPAFQNRQQETVKALQELSQVVPMVGELSADIQLKNIPTPGVDVVAERLRTQMIDNGLIPQDQWTKEEQQEQHQKLMIAQQQPQQPSPEQVIADAEVQRVQAETADIQMRAQLKQEELRIKEQKDLLDAQNKAEKLSLDELTLAMKQQAHAAQQQQATIEAMMKGQAQVFESLNTQAQTLNTLREAMGADAIISPDAAEAYQEQAETITEQQDEITVSNHL